MLKPIQIYQLLAILNTISSYGLSAGKLANETDDEFLSQKERVLEKSYHGLIRENETIVEITPLIKVDEEKICNFRILKKPYYEIPFQIELVNNIGVLKARRTLNCETRKSYHFEFAAVFCDGTHSAGATIHISVIDINEYAPVFLQPSYVTEVDEGRLYKEIVRVEATDKDCTPLFGDICKYEILNDHQPFTIDNEGSIKNTEPLSHKTSHNHILSVIAYDCAMKKSAPIMVSIKVRRVCEARLVGIPERIEYTTSSTKPLTLFPNAHFELCDIYCNGNEIGIRTSVALKTKHISFGCDRDITNCTPGKVMLDLLPRGAEWTKDLSYDEGLEPVFHFDGSSGVIVPNSVIKRYDFAAHPFSIITIFRHFRSPTANKHVKEHIICSADNRKMNRHHVALFIRNCRLILLLRKDFNEEDLNIFSPAEWRWRIPQICDNEWHHYVLNVDQSKVVLYIDGVKFENSFEDRHSNPEVIDDWPLHAVHGVNTIFTVGACYQSSENRLKYGFSGDISEIKLSLNSVLSSEDVKCGTDCAEHLIAPSEKMLKADQQVQSNAQLNEIYIEGTDKASVETTLQQIQYANTKENPTIGRRNIEVSTTIMCINQSAIRLPTIETYIMIGGPSSLPTPAFPTKFISKKISNTTSDVAILSKQLVEEGQAKIIINGNTNHLVSYLEIKRGVRILGNINISVAIEDRVSPDFQYLDSCTVIVFPSLNPDHEEIQVDGDESLSATLDIKTNINKDGVEMVGYDTTSNYLDVLKALIYSNKKPAYYLNRVFKLSCTQLNSEFKGGDFTLTLTVLHPKQSTASTTPPTKLAVHHMQQPNDPNIFAHTMIHSHDIQEPMSRVHTIAYKAKNSHPIMLIILICVFFVILLCSVSIARLRNSNLKYVERNQTCSKNAEESLAWDDSALTITINPMQNEVFSEDSSVSENSDSEDDEDVSGKYQNVSQLEWDNSTM